MGFGSWWLVHGLDFCMQCGSISQCGSAMVSLSWASKGEEAEKAENSGVIAHLSTKGHANPRLSTHLLMSVHVHTRAHKIFYMVQRRIEEGVFGIAGDVLFLGLGQGTLCFPLQALPYSGG